MGVLALDEKVDIGDLSSLDWERKGGGMVVADFFEKAWWLLVFLKKKIWSR